MHCTTPELNTDALISWLLSGWVGWLHVLVRWVGLGSVCKLVGWAGLDEEIVNHIHIHSLQCSDAVGWAAGRASDL